jgi:hypothetical protein
MIKPNAKEVARADGGFACVSRPAAGGGFNVAVVHLDGTPVFKIQHVETKDQIGKAIACDLRMIDKCGFNCPMADASRHRR